jgi:hypothetical protein
MGGLMISSVRNGSRSHLFLRQLHKIHLESPSYLSLMATTLMKHQTSFVLLKNILSSSYVFLPIPLTNYNLSMLESSAHSSELGWISVITSLKPLGRKCLKRTSLMSTCQLDSPHLANARSCLLFKRVECGQLIEMCLQMMILHLVFHTPQRPKISRHSQLSWFPYPKWNWIQIPHAQTQIQMWTQTLTWA